ncbi:hypothetical protein [Pleomorphovibrio marinus]|uniref:hypothetical protein n=1 Tax=Pleomorphovibrio marinus TaxID=2164132 RepID=UPI000E0C6B0A|nr:hypothetical protein [Pleomorphovibrio marinus]
MGATNFEICRILDIYYPNVKGQILQEIRRNRPLLNDYSKINGISKSILPRRIPKYNKMLICIAVIMNIYDPISLAHDQRMKTGLGTEIIENIPSINRKQLLKKVRRAKDFYSIYSDFRSIVNQLTKEVIRE